VSFAVLFLAMAGSEDAAAAMVFSRNYHCLDRQDEGKPTCQGSTILRIASGAIL